MSVIIILGKQMLAQKTVSLVGIGLLALIMAGCNSGSSSSTYQYLQVTTSVNPPVYMAKIGESATITFTNTIVTNAAPSFSQYNISVAVPSSAFTVLTESGNNGCMYIKANQSCNIKISFTPTQASDYRAVNSIQFTVGNLESTVNVATVPNP